MWPQKKLHFSISISLILIPLLLISVAILQPSNPLNYSFFSPSSSSRADQSTNKKREEQERLEKSEAILAKARSSIREASANEAHLIEHEVDDDEFIPQWPIYRNANAFLRSYEEMERVFKIYVYEEGEVPIFHNGPCKSIYSTEGNFMYEIERSGAYRTRDPRRAHMFFLPFSVAVMVQHLYEDGSKDRDGIVKVVGDYVQMVSLRYPFWNSSLGADHFMLSCHDWGPFSTKHVRHLFHNSIRVLCNANTSEGFNPMKDASLPEINLKTGGESDWRLGGNPPLQRPFLAFFAGGLHGHIRHLLLEHWKGKDPQIMVYEKVPTNVSYESMLRSSRFCLCPSGYEVASPRVVEAIYSGCIPVLISAGYVAPFSDVLNWDEFSLVIEVENITNIRTILTSVSEVKYLRMFERLRQVQRHFVMNTPPKRFDLFHMIVHSVWLRRLNIRIRNM